MSPFKGVIFSGDFSGMELTESESLPDNRGKGGAKLDGLLYGIILRLASYVEAMGNRLAVIGLIENEEYTALTGQEGKYGLYLYDGKEAIGPLGCPSVAKIMTHFQMTGTGPEFILCRKDNGTASRWNDGKDKSQVRQEINGLLPKYRRDFEKNGNPFLKYEAENVPSLFDSDKEAESVEG